MVEGIFLSYRLVRVLVARSLGTHLPMPLRQWVIDLYSQIDLIEDFRYFKIWLLSLDKMPAIYRRSGVPYDIAKHWGDSVNETPMDFFDAAATQVKDWRNIFLKVDTKNEQSYKDFWEWTGPNAYQVQVWLADVLRKFINALWAEHTQMLEEQRNPEGHGQEVKQEEGEKLEPTEEEAGTWQETEQLEKRLLERERQEDAKKQQEKSPISAPQ